MTYVMTVMTHVINPSQIIKKTPISQRLPAGLVKHCSGAHFGAPRPRLRGK